jgi:hypothetical protein
LPVGLTEIGAELGLAEMGLEEVGAELGVDDVGPAVHTHESLSLFAQCGVSIAVKAAKTRANSPGSKPDRLDIGEDCDLMGGL